MPANNCYTKVLNLNCYIVLFLLFHFVIGQSQELSSEYIKAENYYNSQDYGKAIKFYNKVLDSEPDDFNANLKIARSYCKLEQLQQADIHYQKVLTYPGKTDPAIFLEYGQLQMKLDKPEIARKYFTDYNNLMESNDIQSFKSQSSIEYSDKFFLDSSFYSIFPFDFNSPANELNPLYYNNKLLYETDQLFFNQDMAYNSIYYLKIDEINVGRPAIIEAKAATKFNGMGFALIQSTNELIISKLKNNGYDTVYQLFSSKLDMNFKAIKEESIVSIDAFYGNIYNPTFSKDGNLLIFSSDVGSQNGTLDLYFANKNEIGYSQPRAIPGIVNTTDNEAFPYLLNDSILFFASDGYGGLGGFDMFYINLNEPNGLPVNIGYPLNTEFNETGISISSAGRQGYIVSNRLGNSKNDLFKFEINKLRAIGLVVDEITGANLRDVSIDVQKVDGYESTQTLADNGNFSIICEPENTYTISISKDGYETKSYQISEIGNAFIGLNNIDIGAFSIKQQFITSPESELITENVEPEKVVPVISDIPKEEEKIIITPPEPDNGIIKFRVQIAASRRKMSSTELSKVYIGPNEIEMFQEENWYKYHIGEYSSFFEANSVSKKSKVKGAFIAAYKEGKKLILKEAIKEVNASKVLSDANTEIDINQNFLSNVVIYYPYNEYKPVKKELDKLDPVIKLANKDPNSKIEIVGYVDNQGNKYYNIGLAHERSKFIMDYLINSSVDPSKISFRSVRQIDINTKALNKNNPENRRVEIKVFK